MLKMLNLFHKYNLTSTKILAENPKKTCQVAILDCYRKWKKKIKGNKGPSHFRPNTWLYAKKNKNTCFNVGLNGMVKMFWK